MNDGEVSTSTVCVHPQGREQRLACLVLDATHLAADFKSDLKLCHTELLIASAKPPEVIDATPYGAIVVTGALSLAVGFAIGAVLVLMKGD